MTFAAPQFLIVLAVIPLLAVFARWFSDTQGRRGFAHR